MVCLTLSAVIITLNEEANLTRTLASVAWADEIVVLDSGSTDRTRDIAESFHAKFLVEPWKGFAAQKNSALAKANGDWILSLDADEEVEPALADEIKETLGRNPTETGFWIPRKNFFLGRWIRHGGFYPIPSFDCFVAEPALLKIDWYTKTSVCRDRRRRSSTICFIMPIPRWTATWST